MPIDLDILESIAATLDEDRGETAAAYVREAIAEIRELRSRVVPPWTREKPTEPGWYWRRLIVPAFDGHRWATGIVRVERDGRSGRLTEVNQVGSWEWSGPLPESPEPARCV